MTAFELMAKIGLDDSAFNSGIDNAEKAGINLGASLEKSFGRIKKAALAIFSAAAIKKGFSEMRQLVNETAAMGDQIDKQSQALGMSRKAYQEWGYILSQNGSSIESMGAAMKTLNNSIIEGSDELAQLGLNMDDLQLMSQEDQFEAVVKAFQKMPPGAQKSALAVKLFGRQGMQLLPLLNNSASSIDDLRKKAEELGLVMSDDAVDASVEYTDALDTMQRTFNALKYSLGTKLMPVFTNVMTKVTNYVGKLKKAFDEKGFRGVIETIRDTLAQIPSKLKLKLANMLGLENPDEATWAEIGKKIFQGLTKRIRSGGGFLKKLILGDEYTEEATWLDVGQKIVGWLSEAFSEGGLLDSLLSTGVESLSSMIDFVSKLMEGVAAWLSNPDNIRMLTDIVVKLVEAIGNAAGPIISALLKILTDPRFWRGLVSALGSLLKAILRMILGKQAADFLFGADEEEIRAQQEAREQERMERRDAESERLQNKLDEYKSEGAPLNQEQKELLKEYFNALMTGGDIGSILDKTFDVFPDNDIINYWLKNIDLFYEKVKDTGTELDTLPDDFFDINKQAELLTNQTANLRKQIESIIGFVEKWAIGYPKFIYSNYLEDFVGTPNHNAKGLWDVPYDDYYTRLHRGEMVLSASRARDYREGSGSKAIDFTDMEDRIVSAIQYGMGKANVNAFVTDRQAGMGANRYTGYKMDAGRFRP